MAGLQTIDISKMDYCGLLDLRHTVRENLHIVGFDLFLRRINKELKKFSN